MFGLQEQELHDHQEQEKDDRAPGAQEVLPALQAPHGPSRSALEKFGKGAGEGAESSVRSLGGECGTVAAVRPRSRHVGVGV